MTTNAEKAQQRKYARKYRKKNREKLRILEAKRRQENPVVIVPRVRTVVCDICDTKFETSSANAKRCPGECARIGKLRAVKAWQDRNPNWQSTYSRKRKEKALPTIPHNPNEPLFRCGRSGAWAYEDQNWMDMPPPRLQKTIYLPIQLQKLPAEQWNRLVFLR